MYKLLLIEDDENLGYILKEYLELHDFAVVWVKDGNSGMQKYRDLGFDLCILDIMLPKKDGFTLAEEMRTVNIQTPFIFLTAKTLKIDKLKGFNLGCDDYIIKPVDEELLIARIRAIIRRSSNSEADFLEEKIYQIGKYQFDFQKQILKIGNREHILTTREASLLKLFCDHKNRLLDRRKALEIIWGDPDYFNRRSMDVFVSKLRKYLNDDSSVKIVNIHGRGFILKIQESESSIESST